MHFGKALQWFLFNKQARAIHCAQRVDNCSELLNGIRCINVKIMAAMRTEKFNSKHIRINGPGQKRKNLEDGKTHSMCSPFISGLRYEYKTIPIL